MPIPQWLRLSTAALGAVATLLAATGCGSGTAMTASSPGTGSSHRAVTAAVQGGEYAWTPPKVKPAGTPTGRPTVEPGPGRDPVTGSTMFTIKFGTGAAVTDPSTARVRYIQQSWDGKHIAHDGWQSSGQAEPVTLGGVGTRIYLALLKARVGDLIEVVAPVRSTAAVAGQSAVIVIAVEAT
ncbi:MAG TPA: hypothetical protein VFU36_12225 [Jatrophihabitans sp.]|nr:hypothetical protein [Jatrophihabitans sp.]